MCGSALCTLVLHDIVQKLQSQPIRHTPSYHHTFIPVDQGQLRPSLQRKVLVLAYYRSGSTLTGQLFNYNPSTFYWFEPLSAASDQWGWMNDVIPPWNWYHFDNGTEK